jgi:hypothetical protein
MTVKPEVVRHLDWIGPDKRDSRNLIFAQFSGKAPAWREIEGELQVFASKSVFEGPCELADCHRKYSR